MQYKQSRFNHVTNTNKQEILLYNSFSGIDSLAVIEQDDYKRYFLEENQCSTDDKKFQSLLNLGYFVDKEVDEKLLVEMKRMDTVEENILRLIILPTEQCNFCCTYCYESFEKGKMSTETQKSLIDYVRRNIMKFSAMEVRWFGGEPMEAMDVMETLSAAFMEICRTAKRSYSASITTNGYLLSLDNFKKLYKWRVLQYQITIDGVKETHDAQRMLKNGKGTFDRIISNLTDIRDHIKTGVPRFTIRTNFTKASARAMDEYLSFFYERFSDDKRFSFSIQRAADWGGDRVKKIGEELIDTDYYGELLEHLSHIEKRLDISPHGALMTSDTCMCYANKRYSFVIGSDGTIYKCTADFTFPENTIGRLENGNMLINEELHAKWITNGWRKYKGCSDCYFEGACMTSSCPASFLKGKKDALCLFEKEYIDKFITLFDRRLFTRI